MTGEGAMTCEFRRVNVDAAHPPPSLRSEERFEELATLDRGFRSIALKVAVKSLLPLQKAPTTRAAFNFENFFGIRLTTRIQSLFCEAKS